MQTGIYEIRNEMNGKRYIGSAISFRRRFSEHRSMLRLGRHHSRHLQASCDKYGIDAFEFRPIVVCAARDLLFYEQRALDVYRPDYNCAPIAGNTLGTRRSAETRAKIAAKSVGRKWTDEAKAKVSATLTGRKMSDAFRQKLVGNQRAKGLRHTDEWKAANSARMMGAKRPKSPEIREKIAASLRGRKATPEARANQSAAQRGKKRGPYKRQTDQEIAA